MFVSLDKGNKEQDIGLAEIDKYNTSITQRDRRLVKEEECVTLTAYETLILCRRAIKASQFQKSDL